MGARERAVRGDPHVKLGLYVRFDEDDVDRWLESCKQRGRPVELRAQR